MRAWKSPEYLVLHKSFEPEHRDIKAAQSKNKQKNEQAWSIDFRNLPKSDSVDKKKWKINKIEYWTSAGFEGQSFWWYQQSQRSDICISKTKSSKS